MSDFAEAFTTHDQGNVSSHAFPAMAFLSYKDILIPLDNGGQVVWDSLCCGFTIPTVERAGGEDSLGAEELPPIFLTLHEAQQLGFTGGNSSPEVWEKIKNTLVKQLEELGHSPFTVNAVRKLHWQEDKYVKQIQTEGYKIFLNFRTWKIELFKGGNLINSWDEDDFSTDELSLWAEKNLGIS